MGAEGRFKEGWGGGGEVDGTDMEGERYTNISERGKLITSQQLEKTIGPKRITFACHVCLDRRANRQTNKQTGTLTSGYCSTQAE